MAERAPDALRSRLALALDCPDLGAARALARSLEPFFAVAKVGLELFCAAGPAAIAALREDGFEVFADLKLHDIPTTVGRAARALTRYGPRYVTVHSAGGAAMLEAAVAGFASGEGPAPVALGVTVLTSEAATDALVAQRAALAARAGCGGLVCAASDLATVGRVAPGLVHVVPGIRPAGAARDDQARVATPEEALRAGAGLLVIGRPITAASDPVAAAAALTAPLAALVAGPGSP